MSQTPLQGYPFRVAYAQESTFGTAPTTGSYSNIGINTDVTFRTSHNWQQLHQLGSKDVAQLVAGKLEHELRVTYHPSNITFAQYAIGNIALSFAIWIQSGTYNLVYSGCRINNIKFEVKVGEATKVTCQIFAAKAAVGAPGTATMPALASNPTAMFFGDTNVQQNTGGSIVTLPALDYDVEVNNNLERIPILGDREARAILERHRVIKGNINLTFNITDPSQWTTTAQILNPSSFSLSCKIGKDDTATNRFLNVSSAGLGVQWDHQEIPLKPTDVIYAKYPFTSKATVTLV